MSKILVNAWKCPDGTILQSRHRHDFVSYTDAEGRSYFVDGGQGFGGYAMDSYCKTAKKRLKGLGRLKRIMQQ